MADEKTQNTADNQNPPNGQLSIQKVYVKDISFECPNSPQVFQEKWEPHVDMELSNDTSRLNEVLHDVVLGITITVKSGDKTVYLIEVKQSGIFHIEGFPDDALERILATVCPNILFPFARELVADIVTRGGFPQLLLAPVNFDAIYMQQQISDAEASSNAKH